MEQELKEGLKSVSDQDSDYNIFPSTLEDPTLICSSTDPLLQINKHKTKWYKKIPRTNKGKYNRITHSFEWASNPLQSRLQPDAVPLVLLDFIIITLPKIFYRYCNFI